MPATYEPIATTTLSSAASTITFSSIPNTYTDLVVVLTGKTTSTGFMRIRFNGDTGANYSWTNVTGDGANAGSYQATGTSVIQNSSTTQNDSSQPFMQIVNVFSYAGSTNKTILWEWNADRNGSGATHRIVGLWRSISAITSISLYPSTGNLDVGSTATLYGIKAA